MKVPKRARLGGRRLLERAAQQHLDAGIDKLAQELCLQFRQVRTAQDLVGDIEQDDRLVRPCVADLAGQLDTDRAGAQQQNPIRARQRAMRLADLLLRVAGVDEVSLRRERVVRPCGEHDVVRVDLLACGRHHPMRFDENGAVPHHSAIREQPLVGKVDPR